VAAGFLALALAAAAGRAAAPGGEWPGWRGANRDAASRETKLLLEWKPGGPPLLWKATGAGVGYASLAVSGGRIFTLGDRDGAQQIVALNEADGKLLWTARLGPPWRDQMGGPRGTPSVAGDLVYALGTEGDLVCVEAATGKERWRRSLVSDFGGAMMSGWKFSESPLVDGDRVVVTPGSRTAALVALDRLTGKEVWRAAIPDLGPKGKDGAGYSSVVVSRAAGIKQYVQLLGRGLVGIRAEDGKFLWGYNRVANDVANVATPVAHVNWVFASTGYQTGSAFLELTRAPSGDALRVNEVYFLDAKTFQNHHGGFVLVANKIYGGHGHGKGFPICVELTTGRVVWGGDVRNAGSGSAAVAYADGNLYFRYENGVVVLIRATPDGYQEKGTLTIPDVRNPSWSHPVIAGGRLYLREQDAVYAYDIRA
jgi:outer membrane protein assembly factor BamB